jgi:hypothetical protein
MMGPQKRRGPDARKRTEAEKHNRRGGKHTGLGGLRALAGDPRVPFMDAMRVHEFQVEDIDADGSIHRVHIEGDRAGERSGWYLLHADGGIVALPEFAS